MKEYILDDFARPGLTVWTGKLARGAGGFPDGRPSALVGGALETERLPGDWRGYETLQFTLFNPWQRIVLAGFELYDQAALDSPNMEYGDFVAHARSLLLGEGITHVIVRIHPLSTQRGDRMLNLSSIRRLSLRIPEARPGEPMISIANLRLSLSTEIDGLAQARPGDAILTIRHLDISCYTHQPEQYEDPADVLALAAQLEAEQKALSDAVRVAQIHGKQTHYADAVRVAADVASKARPLLAWHFSPSAKRRNLSEALALVRAEKTRLLDFLSFRTHADDEDDSNLSFGLVKPVPDLGKLTLSGNKLLGPDGRPVLVCSMSYHNEGALLEFFAPERHKLELFAVGGGSRYDIEGSPVYEAFHAHPGTERVGWKGWCGHLIKDQWAMGGRKENVVICLESPHILSAVGAYNRLHAQDWVKRPGLIYVILAYELSYLCYCEESLRRFRLWLAQRHGDIETLNGKWGTAYASFDEALPPTTQGHAPVPDANRAAWFDWADWNMRRFTDHLKWAYRDIRSLHPDMPICAGGTHSMLSANIGTTGIDEELIINEVDDVILHEGNDPMGIDLFHALSDRPRPLVDPEQGGSCEGWLLNYLHGKSTIAMFWWPKQPSRQFSSSTLLSPAHGDMSIPKVLEHLTTALDVRRISEEIVAFWDLPKEVAIVYSRSTMIQVDPQMMSAHETPYLKALRGSYDAARCLDAGLTFVSERQLAAGKAKAYKLILLPAVRHVPESVFEALDRYVAEGGTLAVLPESLLCDEYNRPMDYLARWGISVQETAVPAVEGYGESRRRYDQNMERPVRFGPGVTQTAAWVSGDLEPLPYTVSGLFQRVETGGEVVARGPEGEALLLHIPRGAGHIWYLTGTPDGPSLHALLDRLFTKAGVARPLRATGACGSRVPGLEARLVRRKHDDLVYLANRSGAPLEFSIETGRSYHRIRELRSLEYFGKAEGVLEKDQVLLFSLRADPARAV